MISVLLTVVAQGLLAVAIALGGDPLLGAAAAATLAICGFVLVAAAALQTR